MLIMYFKLCNYVLDNTYSHLKKDGCFQFKWMLHAEGLCFTFSGCFASFFCLVTEMDALKKKSFLMYRIPAIMFAEAHVRNILPIFKFFLIKSTVKVVAAYGG